MRQCQSTEVVRALSAVEQVYGQETREFLHQAVAQDWLNLVLVAPATALLAALALRGSLRAYSCGLEPCCSPSTTT